MSPGGRTDPDTSARLALVAFGAYVAVAVPLLFRFGSYFWFAGDDWGFLVNRDPTDIRSLLRPHNQHWSTVPILAYQAVWWRVGLNSYRPYQAIVIGLHLTTAALLRLVMRRAGVGPWMASVAAATFVLFGPGQTNIFSGVQAGMVASLAFGIVHLSLADHDGPIERRDWLGVAAGALGVMSSGVGPVLVVSVGLATMLRRAWRAAMFHTVFLAAMFVAWQRAFGVNQALVSPSLGTLADWVAAGESGVLLALGQYPPVAIALGVVLVVGLALAWVAPAAPELRGRPAAPTALLMGALGVFATIGLGRSWLWGIAFARSSRYLGLGAALTLPALGVAGDAVVRRWRLLAPAVFALFLIGIPASIDNFGKTGFPKEFYDGQRDAVLAIAYSPLAEQVPRSVRPDPSGFRLDGVTVGFLLDAKRRGKVPAPPSRNPAIENQLALQLGVSQSDDPPPSTCRRANGALHVKPKPGDAFLILTKVTVSARIGGRATLPVLFTPPDGHLLTVNLPDLELEVQTVTPNQTFAFCS